MIRNIILKPLNSKFKKGYRFVRVVDRLVNVYWKISYWTEVGGAACTACWEASSGELRYGNVIIWSRKELVKSYKDGDIMDYED